LLQIANKNGIIKKIVCNGFKRAGIRKEKGSSVAFKVKES
jgi:hypothetical protein